MIQYMASNLKVVSAEVKVPETGVASYQEMVEFVESVLESRTYVHEDTTSTVLSESIVQSILNRLRIGF